MNEVRWTKLIKIKGKMYAEGGCDSSVEKPVTVTVGNINEYPIADMSIIIESDTGDVYFFNEKTSTWIKQFSFHET